jgi:hypothetical protein
VRSGSRRLGLRSTPACFALSLLAGCSGLVHVPDLPPVQPEVLERSFTPAELGEDTQQFFALLEAIHPDPYRDVSREEVETRRRECIAGLDRPLTRREFQPRLAELVAALGDGHTSVYLPFEEFWRAEDGAAKAFPVDVAWRAGELCVRRTAAVTEDGALGPGARVLAIHGRPAPEIFQAFLAQQSGESESWRVAGAEQSFAARLWLEGARAPFRTKIASALDPSHVFEIDLPGMPFGALPRGEAPGTGTPWRLERRPDGVAVLTLDTLSRDLDDFEDFLEPTFESLAHEPPSALIIDLRRNGGGDSRLGDELLQYLSDRPWRQAARKEWKASAPLKRHLKSLLRPWIRWLPLQYLHPTGRKLWSAPEGQVVLLEEERVEPRRESLRYGGPLAWLIGPGTFSSAVGLAAGAEDCGRGLLVGAETGGVVNGFGEVIAFRLQHTQLGAQISTAFFVRANGDRNVRGGVRPSVVVRPEPGQTGDPVLEAAIGALLPADAGARL